MKVYVLTDCAAEKNYTPRVFLKKDIFEVVVEE